MLYNNRIIYYAMDSQDNIKGRILMKHLLSKKIGIIFIAVQFLITVAFIGLALYVDILPFKYLIMAALILIFIMLYTFFSQMSKRLYIVGRVLSGIFCIVMIMGTVYLWRGYSTINRMAAANIKVDELSVIVLAEDAAQTIDDAGDYGFGIISELGREYTDSMVSSIQTDLGRTISTVEYDDMFSLVEALYNKSVGAVIFNEAYRGMVKEQYEEFDTQTKVLGQHQIETVVNVEEEEDIDFENLKKPFIMYLSGIDVYGSLSKTSRSDVNIIAVINPETSQILLVNTPRDYFIPLSISNGVRDKLTHAGLYGVDVSIETLEMLYDIDIDYYMRVNFSGLKNIVDALGGVKVYSDYTFTSDWGPSFKKGYNKVNGKEALAFCRERHHVPGGDNQRGRNHQHMIAAIMDKATSPKIITKFSKLMKSLEDSFETNMKTNKITKYVKYQMAETPAWNIDSISVTGRGGYEWCYSIRNKPGRQVPWIMYEDESSVEKAKDAIKTIFDGGKLNSSKDKKNKTDVTDKPDKTDENDNNN